MTPFLTTPKTCRLFATILLSICLATSAFSQKNTVQKTNAAELSQYSLLNINNIMAWFRADGVVGQSPVRRKAIEFPRGTAGVVFQDGFWWGGKVYLDSAMTQPAPHPDYPNNLFNIRVGGAMYSSSTREGRIIDFGAEAVPADSTDPSARIYRIRRDYFAMSESELRVDAADFFETTTHSVTTEQIQALRERYEKDWREWPVQFGAPFIDRNGHGSDADFLPFDLLPPAVGYCLIRGPRVSAESGWRYLLMTSFTYRFPVSFFDPPTTEEYYKMLRGFAPEPGPHIYYNHPPGVTPGPFPLSGDPVTRSGHIDGQGTDYSFVPGDRQIMIASGPFTLAPGDSQEVIIAFVAGIGSSHLASLQAAKLVAGQVRTWYPYRPFFEREQPQQPDEQMPQIDYALSQNYPNPFNASTRIDFALPVDAEVRLAIFDVLGHEIAVLLERPLSAGTHSALWDGRDASGEAVPSGHYFYKLQAGHIELTRGLTLIR